MKFALGPDTYAEWTPGARTINYWHFTLYAGDTGGWEEGRWVNYDCSSFGYDKPDNSTTQLEALAVILRHDCQHLSLDDCGRSCHHLECPDCGLLIDTPDVYFVDEEA